MSRIRQHPGYAKGICVVLTVCAASAVIAAPTLAESRSNYSPKLPLSETPKVICVTSYYPPEGAYRRKPPKCVFHARGEFPLAGANTITTEAPPLEAMGRTASEGKGKALHHDGWMGTRQGEALSAAPRLRNRGVHEGAVQVPTPLRRADLPRPLPHAD
jgi:hypothetical protein